MLFLHGTRDPFGSPEEMQSARRGLPGASLHLIEGGDHSLQASRRGDRSNTAIDHAIDLSVLPGLWPSRDGGLTSNARSRTDMMP